MRHKKEIITVEDATNPITVSFISGSNVFKGQSIYLSITIDGEKNPGIFNKIAHIKIKPKTGSEHDFHVLEYVKYSSFNLENRTFGSTVILLEISEKITSNNISFTVVPIDNKGKDLTGFKPLPITYNIIKNTPPDIIILKTENEFIETPTTQNIIPNGTNRLYEGKVEDASEKSIKNTQIMITTQHNQFSPALINIATSEGNPIAIIGKQGERHFFVLKSDEHGKISFRAYPIQGQSARIDFVAKIANISREEYTAVMCIFPFDSKNRPLDNPFIFEMDIGGILKKSFDDTSFNTQINLYPGASKKDVLAFFTEYDNTKNKTLLSPTYRTGDVGMLSETPFPFTYDQLVLNQQGGLYYMVVKENGSPVYSDSLQMMYVGGDDSSEPDDDSDTVYDKPVIYSSYITKSEVKPSYPGARVYESASVAFDTISQQLIFGEYIDNSQNAGLYVVIQITNNSAEKLPTPDQKGTVKVSIKSSKNIQPQKYDFDLATKKLLTDGNRKYQIVTIPFCLLKEIHPIGDYRPSRLHIYYEITAKNNKKTKSKLFGVNIDTSDPSGPDFENYTYYGCPS
ncbi:hypothetical protein [Xenorhabdus lircayensis]|uniref:Inverse autotransporter beta-barrel domain-containing protein n=1 Tax=Xenorhabdus lircayensis TaxID=2763499 RepID=A0ABS0U1D3_9GAMM|nr:hypothetical protein [Xenorhabdus lircayensis]MBI6547697.1 hypothetical protein [Xenorhabdus lircayensis]